MTRGCTPRPADHPSPVSVGPARSGGRALVAFFVLAFALSWAWVIPLAVSHLVVDRGQGWPTHYPALFGPAVAAVLVVAGTTGRQGIAQLLQRLAGLKRRSRHDRVKFALARRDWRAYGAWCSLHSATTAHLTCRYALRVMVNIPRRSEWWRSATLTAGPCVSLLEIRKPTTACLVGHRAQPG
jgi:hypothetical protein